MSLVGANCSSKMLFIAIPVFLTSCGLNSSLSLDLAPALSIYFFVFFFFFFLPSGMCLSRKIWASFWNWRDVVRAASSRGIQQHKLLSFFSYPASKVKVCHGSRALNKGRNYMILGRSLVHLSGWSLKFLPPRRRMNEWCFDPPKFVSLRDYYCYKQSWEIERIKGWVIKII